MWLDVALTSASDTVAWILAPNGDDLTRHVSVWRDERGVLSRVTREKWNGRWYLSGTLGDTASQAICYKRRTRDAGMCLPFRMDTVSGLPFLRRLRVYGYRDETLKVGRLFVERRP